MEKKRASAIMLALLLTSMLTLAFNIQPANAGTITVPDDYATIQGAINAASDGDTINVRAGTYYENVIINKKVSLVGEDRGTTIIDGSGNGNVVCMTSAADTANISSFTLRNGRGINDGAGIDVQSSSNHTITGNIITDNQRGLRLQFSRYNVICDNEITSNIETGIELRSSHWNSIFRNTASGNGLNIWIIGSSVNNIAGNEVADGDWGICLTESFNNTLRNNNMKQNRFNFAVQGARVQDYIHDIDFSNFVNGKAVYYMVGKKNLVIDTSVYPEVGYIGIVNCENMTVKNLNLEANAEGIKLVNTTGSLIKNLRINGVSAGISIEFGSCNNTVSKNVVLWCEMVGIYLHGSSCYNVIYENQVTCLNSGIRTLDSSDDNLVYHNTFFQYFPQQMSFGSTNTWDNGYPSGGNYWSDYTGVDVNSDGIGDTLYVIDVGNQDNYPLVHPYGSIRNLNTSLDYLTIQSAIDAPETLNGHTLFVESGTYYEHVTVTKSLSLIGQSANTTIIDAFFIESAVHIMADNVRFEGFTVTHGGENFPNGGILLQLSTNCTISNNIAIDNKMGILLISSNGNSISNNFVSNNIHGVELYGYSNKNVLESNNISDNNAGILLSQSSGNMIKSNAISRNNFGIEIGGASNDNMISRNTVSDAGAVGIRSVDQSVRNIILNNIVTRSLDAFDLTYANDCMLIGNTASFNSRYGIIIGSSNNSLVIANDLVNNGYGLGIYYPNTNNTISHNNFISNAHQTDTFPSPLNNKWDDGYPSGGNYWSDYVGVDVKSGLNQDLPGSDGIGDTLYIIDADNQDRYPLMKLWTLMPTVYTFSIVWEEETFTVSVASNSTVSNFAFNQPNKEISFYVTGPDGTIGFSNVTIPKQLLYGEPWSVLIDGISVTPTIAENETHSILYFTYTHSTHKIQIIGTYVIAPPPSPLSVSISPLSASILVGQSVTFTSTVSGGYTPYSYQWYLNGAPVSGATSASWTFTPTTSGIYYIYLKVTDAKANTAQSDTARIVVATVPVGGYSFPIQVQTKTEPVLPYIALIVALTAIFTRLRPKTKRKR